MLNFDIVYEKITANQDKIYHIQVLPKDVIIFGNILESLEGWAFYSTIDSKNSIMLVEAIKDYVSEIEKLLDKMKRYDF
ncbi:MAG: DUF4911 domain-containing protein [Candidatus Cloacimonetes bacterium]|nr:DUF4911 domain-containing protein [Candidatus Cloacimonadota bacterium]